jgi:hypothetical protein
VPRLNQLSFWLGGGAESKLAGFPAARVKSSRASPFHRPRENGPTHPADTSRSHLAPVLGLLSEPKPRVAHLRLEHRVHQRVERHVVGVVLEATERRRSRREVQHAHAHHAPQRLHHLAWFVVGCQYTVCCSTSCWTSMGWWAPVCCGMSVHCVLQYLLLDIYGVVGTGLLWGVSTLCALVPPPGLYGWWAPVCCGVSVHSVL